MSEFSEALLEEIRGVWEPAPGQVELLERHFDLLVKWNQRLNLTRVTDVREAVRWHYCESIFLGRELPAGPLRIADLGSGGGFPGVPIAVSRPECSVTLIESHRRKAVFLRESTRGMGNVAVAGTRGEDVEEEFDWVVCRAVRAEEVVASGLGRGVGLLTTASEAVRLPDERVGWGAAKAIPWHAGHVVVVGSRLRDG